MERGQEISRKSVQLINPHGFIKMKQNSMNEKANAIFNAYMYMTWSFFCKLGIHHQ
jgi:hypothetical protein